MRERRRHRQPLATTARVHAAPRSQLVALRSWSAALSIGLAACGRGLAACGLGLAARGRGLAAIGCGLAARGRGLAALSLGLAALGCGAAALPLAAAPAYASEVEPAAAPAGPPTSGPASTTVATPPLEPPAQSSQPAAQSTSAPTAQTTQSAPAPAPPQAVAQRAQPSSGRRASRRGSPPSTLPHGGGAAVPSGPAARRPAGGAVTLTAQRLAPAPGMLTPALPAALAGPLGGVPSFFINSFSIPPFLLPIYQAAGAAYGIPWQVLAAINEVETDYGRDLSVSAAGAEGWMQFLPGEWLQFGVDVNNDGFEDPYNPADAIFAAARYLKDAGGQRDVRAAVFAYNHSKAYVESVLLRARLLSGTPPALLGAVTGLSEGRFPVHAPAHYSDGFSTTSAGRTLVGTTIYSQPDAPAIAVQDGRIARIGRSPALGRYVSLTDVYGNTYTYAQLGTLAALYPVLEGARRFSLHALHEGVRVIAGTVLGHLAGSVAGEPHMLFQIEPAGARAPLIDPKPVLDGWVKLEDSSAIRSKGAASLHAAVPTPGQALLESKAQLERQIAHERAIPIASCERRLIADGRVDRRLLALVQFLDSAGFTPTVSSGGCARVSRAARAPARRLGGPAGAARASAAGAGPDVQLTAIDGRPVSGASGRASSAAISAVRRLLGLQGTMRPAAIAGPAGLPRAANVIALPGRAGRIEISFDPSAAPGARAATALGAGLSPAQWVRLIARLGQIPDPTVQSKPSAAAIPDRPPSTGGRG